jgi:transcriptional regulator with XRE-family HTH domain
VEETVTAGIAIMAPRGITSTVSVAVEFGRAGHGWAGAIVFNVWLRRQMRERRMSQRQLALLSGVDHSTISRLVSGERVPSLATATRLARALGRVDDDGDAFAYFARLPEETVFPTTRVEMALRGDDEIDDDDVRSLMSAYLDARTRRRRARQLSGGDNGASVGPPPAVDPIDPRSEHRRARRGPKDAVG